jgi:hypothetical protein
MPYRSCGLVELAGALAGMEDPSTPLSSSLWGGPPGPRGSPWTRSSLEESRSETSYGPACRILSGASATVERHEGVPRGTGGPPHKLIGVVVEILIIHVTADPWS